MCDRMFMNIEVIDDNISELGVQIYEASIQRDYTKRDDLLNEFLSIIRKDFEPFNLEVYEYVVLADHTKYHNPVPKLIIHGRVEDLNQAKRMLKTLREYFHIQGGLKLPVFGLTYRENDEDLGSFTDNEDELNLLFDFIEYKNNENYKLNTLKE